MGCSTSQDKEGKPGSSAEALDRSGPAAAGAVSSSLTTEGLWGQERGCRVEVNGMSKALAEGGHSTAAALLWKIPVAYPGTGQTVVPAAS